jgi:hypothetical protein
MTLAMADSIYVANLPASYSIFAGYTDGSWPTYTAVRARFPKATVLSVAVFTTSDAECCDCEQGDLTPAQVPAWVRRQATRGEKRPCVYASAANMPAVLRELTAAGIARAQVRLWSAHYGLGPHICGPATCKYPGVPACDGTQWTDMAPGAHGSRIDASLLNDNFFTGGTGTVSATGPEHWDDADWTAFRQHELAILARAATGDGTGLAGAAAAAVTAARRGLMSAAPSAEQVATAVVAKLPPAQAGGLTQAQVQAAVEAGLVAVLSKAVTGA